VRFKRLISRLPFVQCNDFNSTLVRFKPYNYELAKFPVKEFQFHFGAIQTPFVPLKREFFFFISIPLWCDSNVSPSTAQNFGVYDFNSTLVRFKLPPRNSSQQVPTEFQFHFGAIQTLELQKKL